MVTMANISDKASILTKAQTNKNSPSSSFLPTSPHKYHHNSIIFGCTENWFAPSCSSRDSASGDILVIDIFKMADDTATTEFDFLI